jgi:hypothetical protein
MSSLLYCHENVKYYRFLTIKKLGNAFYEIGFYSDMKNNFKQEAYVEDVIRLFDFMKTRPMARLSRLLLTS